MKSEERADPFKTLAPVFIYYFATLLLLTVYKFTGVFNDSFEDFLVINVVDILLVLVFCVAFYRSLVPLYSFRNVSVLNVLKVVGGSILGAIVVHFLATGLNAIMGEDEFYSFSMFETTRHPELFAVLFICVQPAIFEEVAFRGFLFNNISDVTSRQGAVYVTSFMFGVIHLAFLGLVWLVPIGLAFALLRLKFNTLWYGMIGHFTYNFVIIAIEYINLNHSP